MKTKKPNYYKDIIEILSELKVMYPSFTIGRHLSTALSEYGDMWGIPDKEILYALEKYRATLEMDVPHEVGDKELEEIIKDGMNLSI
jgi:hypothetical protein